MVLLARFAFPSREEFLLTFPLQLFLLCPNFPQALHCLEMPIPQFVVVVVVVVVVVISRFIRLLSSLLLWSTRRSSFDRRLRRW